MRRPGTVALVTAAAMVAVAAPALTTTWSSIDASVIPKDKSARTVADALASGAAGKAPVTVAIAAPESARAQVAAYAGRVGAVDDVQRTAAPRYLGANT